MPKLFSLDSGTVREIVKLHALDGATPRRVKKLFGLDGSTVRLIFEDFSSFLATGQANLINSPVNEVIDFGVRSDFNSGGADVNVNTSGTGDTNNVGGISGLSIDVDSSHTYTGTAPYATGTGVALVQGPTINGQTTFGLTGYTTFQFAAYLTAQTGSSRAIVTSRASNVYFYGYFAPAPIPGQSGGGADTSKGLMMQGNGFFNRSNRSQASLPPNAPQGLIIDSPNSEIYRWQGGGGGWTYRLNLAIDRSYYPSYPTINNYVHIWMDRMSGSTVVGSHSVSYTGTVLINDSSLTATNTGRRARVVNGSNRIYFIGSGGLTAGGNFTGGNLAAGASSAFVTANSSSEAWTLTGTAHKTPASYSISNADNSIQVSGNFTDDSDASSARDQIQAALNANSTFQGKFNTGVDADKTVGGVAHKIVKFTSDSAENTSDFSMTITQNDGSNTTPHEETVTQGETESLQTTVTVTRQVEGSEVATATAISSEADVDTAGNAIASNTTSDVTYDASTNKLKVQDRDATVTIANANTLAFTKQ